MTANERQLEDLLVEKMGELKYVVREDVRDLAALKANFRERFQELNCVVLTDDEFNRLYEEIVTPDVFLAAQRLRERNTFVRDDDNPLHFTLVNTKEWCKNTFEVVRQLRINTESSHHRYDVLLLINGVPVAQIELKTLGISPKKAMEQIVQYKKDPGNGYERTLLCFLQIFIVSNGNATYYFANNDERHFSFKADERFLPVYEFAKRDNTKVSRLFDFADAFLAKCELAQTISRYMVLVQSEAKLLMMRPYQIYAVKEIVRRIEENAGNGYVWHTTGSGKTLTSFKASTLLKANDDIHKCLFVVDRKDLDRQTREEFNRFQEGCVEENTNTGALVRRLLSDDHADKVIVTTIQKLGLALNGDPSYNGRERLAPLRDKRMAIIFDECHRSQFGENHQAIKEFFPRAQMFGFTGTPIFESNSTTKVAEGEMGFFKTTEQLFGDELHAYTITHAIDDGNVLRFHVDFYEPQGEAKPKPGEAPTKAAIVETILQKHNAATGDRRFNALFATASINDAIEYCELFEQTQRERERNDPDFKRLNVACVFSPPGDVSADVRQLQQDLLQEREDNKLDPEGKKRALAAIIASYNQRYGTNHSLSEFDLYYGDVQKRIKDQQFLNSDVSHDRKIDVAIVVDMLLTGFDSKYLNTLYVDKNLKHHGLIQAFSRTNRVLNATKPFGNILDFRGQREAVDEAIALFSGSSARPAREIWLVEPAPKVIEHFERAVEDLDLYMRSQRLSTTPDEVSNLKGDAARAVFVERFKEVQRIRAQLDQYTDLTPAQRERIEAILPEDARRGFKGKYLEIWQKTRPDKATPEPAPETRNLDFELVLFATAKIDYDYIMGLIARLSNEPIGRMKTTADGLIEILAADAKFLDDRETLAAYVRSLTPGKGMNEHEVRAGYGRFKAKRESEEVEDIAGRFGVSAEGLAAFVADALARGAFDARRFSDLFAPLGLGWREVIERERALRRELEPVLRRRSGVREIRGLARYEAESEADGR